MYKRESEIYTVHYFISVNVLRVFQLHMTISEVQTQFFEREKNLKN